MPDPKIRVGAKVKSLRSKKGMSIDDVSQKTGIPASVIAGIEEHTISPLWATSSAWLIFSRLQ